MPQTERKWGKKRDLKKLKGFPQSRSEYLLYSLKCHVHLSCKGSRENEGLTGEGIWRVVVSCQSCTGWPGMGSRRKNIDCCWDSKHWPLLLVYLCPESPGKPGSQFLMWTQSSFLCLYPCLHPCSHPCPHAVFCCWFHSLGIGSVTEQDLIRPSQNRPQPMSSAVERRQFLSFICRKTSVKE